MASLDDLISPETEEESLSYHLTELANVGFPTTSWSTGGVIYTLVQVISKTRVDLINLITAITKGGLLDLATGLWLTLLAAQIFLIDRYTATFARGKIRLFITPGFPSQTIQPGQLWVKTASGKRYNSRNVAPVTILPGATDLIEFQAESRGASFNVAINTALTLVTPLPGMTATFEDVGDGTPWVVQGADEESDPALRIRCRTKWALLGANKIRDAYVQLATNVPGLGTQPNRVNVDDQNPRGPNTIDIWLAGPSGPLPGPDVTLVDAWIQARKSPCSDVQVNAAIPRPITVASTVYREGSYKEARAQAVDNVTTYIQALPLGGTVLRAQVVEEIMAPDGVKNCELPTINAVAADLTIGPNEVATVNAVGIVDVIQN